MKKWLAVMMGFVALSWNINAAPTTVVAWGSYPSVSATLTNVIALAQGEAAENILVIRDGGIPYQWGDYSSPPSGLSNIVAISSGQGFSLALKDDGTVVGWGTQNGNGQTTIPPGLSNFVAISAGGENFSLALKNDGTLAGWGYITPPSSLSNIVAIASGWDFSLGIRNDGTVVGWGGNNGFGQRTIPSGLSNVVAVAGGYLFSMALKSDGTVVQWGFVQTNIPIGLSNVVAITAGTYCGYALKSDGTVVGWGDDTYGEIDIPSSLSNVVAISAAQTYGLALQNDGSPYVEMQPHSQTVYSGMPVTFSETVVSGTPCGFQWSLNGTNILGATNAFLSLTNVQTTNSGNYSVILSNAVGVVISSNAILAVSNSPPIISQPASQIVVVLNSNAVVTVVTIGSLPQYYQWQLNGNNLAGATNTFLNLTNVQLTNSGNYAVIVTNAYGYSTGLVASLTVMDLGAALNATNLVWTTSSSYPWFPENSTNHDGIAAAQSGSPPFPQYSTLQTTVTGPGTLTFWAECSQFFDHYIFSASGSYGQAVVIPPFAQWTQETVYLGAGTQSLQWLFQKSPFGSFGLDAVWLDQVNFIPGGTSPMIISAPTNCLVIMNANTSFTVSAIGTPSLAYQWQFNGTNLANQTNVTLSLLNVQPTNSGIYSVVITNNYGNIFTNAALFVEQFALDTSPTNLWMTTNGFQLQLDGILTANPVVILASTNLVSWLPIYTNPATTGSIQFLDFAATNLPARFYRAQE
jgi:hypothetical protein